MSTVHVTITAPDSKLDLTVPADLPIRQLMPSLLELAGLSAGSGSAPGWTIALPGADPLPVERTLADCGVADGAVLALHLAAQPGPGGADEGVPPAATDPPEPSTGATATGATIATAPEENAGGEVGASASATGKVDAGMTGPSAPGTG
ncbi:MAG: EsaB/YukD family protein, partial [Thermoleophilaceae bacterium]